MSERHHVRGSRRQKGYFRRRPYTYEAPTRPQRQARAILARTAFEKGRDKEGKAEIEKNGEVKEIPASAIPIMKEMTGKTFAPPTVPPAPVSPFQQLRRAFDVLAQAI